jgi:hypothetical protein
MFTMKPAGPAAARPTHLAALRPADIEWSVAARSAPGPAGVTGD